MKEKNRQWVEFLANIRHGKDRPVSVPADRKACYACWSLLPVTRKHFNLSYGAAKTRDGFANRCKKCHNAYIRAYRASMARKNLRPHPIQLPAVRAGKLGNGW